VVRACAKLCVLPCGQDDWSQAVVSVLGSAVVGLDGWGGLVQRHENRIHSDDLVPWYQYTGCDWLEGIADEFQFD
jgi:hypothetical protein